MADATEAATSETAVEEQTSETTEETTSQNTGLSQEAIAEMQARIDALTAESTKFKTKAEQQEGRAKKAELLLKAGKSDVAEQIDELQQKFEIASQTAESLKTQNAILIDGQKQTAVQNAVLSVATGLAEGAAPMLATLMVNSVGIKDGQVIVLTDQGTPRISGQTGKQMTVSELCTEILDKSPFLKKSGVVSGQNTGNNTTGASDNVTALLAELDKLGSYERQQKLDSLPAETKKAVLEAIKF